MDRLRDELGQRLQIIQLDLATPLGREMARRLRAEFTPTFILFDGGGNERWRSVGFIDPGRVRESLE